ncbi:MAG: DEAD/DEAH box helicase family protein, partial [Actinomycetota bacterium]|nr:DEAD/DEAH box helicase family protein [Actinomycetota bacterium]
FQGFTTPDDGRKFTELYNVQHLSSNHIDPVARVTISTIQRIYSILRGETSLDEELDEHSAFELAAGLLPVEYNPRLPPEFFDAVIVDECHRSIYGLWRQVLDYFDAFTIGLTATPNKQAFGFFNQNLVMEYGHEQAVVDGVNVDFDVYRIRTEITERGSTIDAGLWTKFRDRQTRRARWELLDDDLSYGASELDRAVVARDQIRTVLETFRDRLFTEIFPGRSDVPKTLIFAKDDAHAEEIVQIARDVFGKGNDFVAKITYKATGRRTDDLIAAFRTSPNPRIAVTVDMIATGTDVKPLECVFFMRSVRSRTYFEQMKGRGVRVISDTDLQAVVDGVNVDFDVYRIRTEITERGSTIDAGMWTRFRDRPTRRSRWELLDEDLSYGATELDRAVVARDQIRTVLEIFRDRLFTEIFPGRTEVPKTLIFAKDDAHAEEIVELARDVFGKGNDFVAKITYKATGRKTDDLIAAFRNSANPRIAVTVDMIATGTDVKPLECVFFMRSVKSRTYFEQMKGRGVRVISDTDLQAVVPGATSKERFVIVDAVGVTETELQDSPPLDRQPTVSLDRLFKQVSFGVRDPDTISTIASRLSRLDRRLSDTQRNQLTVLAQGTTLKDIARGIVRALDPDRRLEAARAETGRDEPTVDEIAAASKKLLDDAVAPLATNPDLRQRIVEARRTFEQAIDETSRDEVLEAGYSADATDRARGTVESWERFCEENRDEITALEILYARRQPQRLTFREVKELAQAIEQPPHRWTPERLWEAYEALDRSKVRGSGERVLTDLVSLVRVALHQEDELVPYPELVRERYRAWLLQQENAGRVFTAEQLAWLERIRDHVAASLGISADDFAYTPFVESGGLGKAAQVFGDDLGPLLEEMNEALVT